jgi:hypothetical protein
MKPSVGADPMVVQFYFVADNVGLQVTVRP